MLFTGQYSPIIFIIWLLGITYAITVHEFSHAFAAWRLGDHTAKDMGRLSFNPLRHIDLIGFLFLIFAGFGWGKPVIYNPYNLRNQKWGPAIISVAGPLANVISVFFFGLILFLLQYFKVTLTETTFLFIWYLILINAILCIFNLLPIPPLDGSKLLFAILPASAENFKINFQRWGIFVLLAVVFLGQSLLTPLFNGVQTILMKLFLR